MDHEDHQQPRSKFTFRQFANLTSHEAPKRTPLSVVAHIDLDAFYAQCELVRLNLDESTPLVCQQWKSNIAVNYPARKYGIVRHETVQESRSKCPHLVAAHTATYKAGDTQWKYHSDPEVATHKVSLDPYRIQSRRIFALFGRLVAGQCLIEKGGIDEAFIDLSPLVHSQALALFPQLATNDESHDEFLPLPPSDLALDVPGVVIEDEYPDHEPMDWDDVFIMLGAIHTAEIRSAVYKELRFTCSAGIARNKVLAKLGSAENKPNNQTCVRNRCINSLLTNVPFKKMWGLGGKLGKYVDEAFSVPEVESIPYMQTVPLADLQAKLGQEQGVYIYNMVRGIDPSPICPRTDIKSMMSAKNLRPHVTCNRQVVEWLTVFIADIVNRLQDLELDSGLKRRPKTMSLHMTPVSGTVRSKQRQLVSLSSSRPLYDELFHSAQQLLTELTKPGLASPFPCHQLNLQVGSFTVYNPEISMDQFVVTGKPHINENGYFCSECNASVIDEEQEHKDWHFAKKLSAELRKRDAPSVSNTTTTTTSTTNKRVKKAPSKGQMQLSFAKR